MFDDILGPREEKVELRKTQEDGSKEAGDRLGILNIKMNAKKSVPPSIGGLSGRPVTGSAPTPGNMPKTSNHNDPWEPEPEHEDDCGCEGSCESGDCQGCLDESRDDSWSTYKPMMENPCEEVELL